MPHCKTLQDFWEWANISAEAYAKGMICKSVFEELEYPNWLELIGYAKAIIDFTSATPDAIDTLMTIMAIDNEREEILDYLSYECDNSEFIQTVVAFGCYHLQPNARWQVAELAGRRKPAHYHEYLRTLSKDTNEYVRRRAESAIELYK